MAGTAWGFYGVPSVKGMAEADRERLAAGLAGIDTVFVPEDPETMAFFKGRGFRVFLSMNAFGGRGAWKTYPDARPVRADGRLLGEAKDKEGNDDGGHGGVCPTHAGWRAERLKRLETLASRYLATGAADGIWLDFIRYPGFWETPSPKIPDTCYCPRCLEKFRKDKGVGLPAGLTAPAAAAWIAEHCPYEWMDWKQEQILSFVRVCGKMMRDRAPISARLNRGSVPLHLGAFVVPWTRGEREGAVCFRLGQDPFRLSEIVDVLSPMVYHRMVGREAGWVGRMTAYYKETARCAVWPILQTVDVPPAEVAQAVAAARAAVADGLLAYKFEKGDCAPHPPRPAWDSPTRPGDRPIRIGEGPTQTGDSPIRPGDSMPGAAKQRADGISRAVCPRTHRRDRRRGAAAAAKTVPSRPGGRREIRPQRPGLRHPPGTGLVPAPGEPDPQPEFARKGEPDRQRQVRLLW
jgi:hypothetical protein